MASMEFSRDRQHSKLVIKHEIKSVAPINNKGPAMSIKPSPVAILSSIVKEQASGGRFASLYAYMEVSSALETVNDRRA